VPESHVKDGKIVLNISPAATRALTLGLDVVTFETRFNGVPHELVIPIDAVLGIYARETGQSVVFGEETAAPRPDGDEPPPARPAGGKPRAKLKVVK
jgi:stringent starvation protein B